MKRRDFSRQMHTIAAEPDPRSVRVNPSKASVREGVLGYASRLKFPKLFMLTAALFVADLIVPDFIPFVDEILLGLGTLLLGSLRTQVRDRFRTVDEPRG